MYTAPISVMPGIADSSAMSDCNTPSYISPPRFLFNIEPSHTVKSELAKFLINLFLSKLSVIETVTFIMITLSASDSTTTNDFVYEGWQLGEIVVTDSDDTVVYDLVPAKDSDNKCGFYEKVHGVFYYNATYATTGYICGNWE